MVPEVELHRITREEAHETVFDLQIPQLKRFGNSAVRQELNGCGGLF
jgi:hypothetical protein